MSERVYKFSWDLIGDLQEGRPNMGSDVSLVLYRLMQYTFRDVLEQHFGTEACDKCFYEAGKLAGASFYDRFLKEFKDLPLPAFVAELQRIVKEQGIGILRVEKADVENGKFVLTVAEDLDCSGLPDIGVEVCNYDEGFIAGIFDGFTGLKFVAKEVDCWCTGERVCRFEVNKV